MVGAFPMARVSTITCMRELAVKRSPPTNDRSGLFLCLLEMHEADNDADEADPLRAHRKLLSPAQQKKS